MFIAYTANVLYENVRKTLLFAEKKYLIYNNLSCSKLHFFKRLIQEIYFTFIQNRSHFLQFCFANVQFCTLHYLNLFKLPVPTILLYSQKNHYKLTKTGILFVNNGYYKPILNVFNIRLNSHKSTNVPFSVNVYNCKSEYKYSFIFVYA